MLASDASVAWRSERARASAAAHVHVEDRDILGAMTALGNAGYLGRDLLGRRCQAETLLRMERAIEGRRHFAQQSTQGIVPSRTRARDTCLGALDARPPLATKLEGLVEAHRGLERVAVVRVAPARSSLEDGVLAQEGGCACETSPCLFDPRAGGEDPRSSLARQSERLLQSQGAFSSCRQRRPEHKEGSDERYRCAIVHRSLAQPPGLHRRRPPETDRSVFRRSVDQMRVRRGRASGRGRHPADPRRAQAALGQPRLRGWAAPAVLGRLDSRQGVSPRGGSRCSRSTRARSFRRAHRQDT